MSEAGSIFERIEELVTCGPAGPAVDFFGAPLRNRTPRKYRWQPTLDECVHWLQGEGLTRAGKGFAPPDRDAAILIDPNTILGLPVHRAQKHKKEDLDRLKKAREERKITPSPSSLDQMWNEYKDPAGAIRALDIHRLPSDALAFYRPFHFTPHDEWGIYIMVEKLLHYCKALYNSFNGKLASFSEETLIGCVLFEVFHHEFFHHLTECAATTMEVASASFGDKPRSLYMSYWNHGYEKESGMGRHVDHPLEEALANAYAYNSFSFLSRMQLGYKLVWVRLYQKVLEKCWAKEPPGYRSAGRYIKDGYVSGGAQLLAMILGSPALDPASLMLLAKTVLPSGNSAFLQKPDVPTYLVGSSESLEVLDRLVPAPNETYTSLFWLGDSSKVDQYLNERKQKEAEAKTLDRKR